MWVPGTRCQYSGIIRFIDKPGVQDDMGRHVAKRSSDLPAALRHGRTRQSKKLSNDQELIQSDPTSCPQNQKGNN